MKNNVKVGRIVHVYSKKIVGSPTAGIVIAGGFGDAQGPGKGEAEGILSVRANVNVFLDGSTNAELLEEFRERKHGNTIANIRVFDPMTPEQRASIKDEYFAEFPAVDRR